MSTVLEPPPSTTAPAERLHSTMTALRLSFTWFGTRKTLSSAQKAEAADTFGADGPFVSAGKKLLDTSDPRYRAVTAVRTKAIAHWKSVSLPYPEPGLRLIPHDAVVPFGQQMEQCRRELRDAVVALDDVLPELRTQARERLGRLFDSSDYPDTLVGLFDMAWEFPAVDPPEYLRQLSPRLYERECERVRSRFAEAVELAEQAFIEEFSRLVTHLTERLSGDEDGRPKVFRDSAVDNLREFFDRFSQLNVRSNAQLDDLVRQARDILGPTRPQMLRDDESLRSRIGSRMAGVQASLDGLLVDRPRRSILRPGRRDD